MKLQEILFGNIWLFVKPEPGTLAYALEVQANMGGNIYCSDGWYWVADDDESAE